MKCTFIITRNAEFARNYIDRFIARFTGEAFGVSTFFSAVSWIHRKGLSHMVSHEPSPYLAFGKWLSSRLTHFHNTLLGLAVDLVLRDPYSHMFLLAASFLGRF